MAGIGIWQLVIVLVIVLLLFGTKKLRNIGGDLGGAIRSFRSAMKDGGNPEEQADEPDKLEQATVEGASPSGELHEEKKRA